MDKSAIDKKEAKNDKESDSAATAQELVIRVAIIIVASPVRNC